MAHITEFSVFGLAGRKGCYSQRLNRDVNIFYGLNGSGKTSLLKILDSAMNHDATTLERVPFKSAEVRIYSILYDKVFTHTIERLSGRKREDIQITIDTDSFVISDAVSKQFRKSARLAWKIKPKGSEETSFWSHQYLPTSRLYVGPSRLRSTAIASQVGLSQLSEEELDLYFADALQALWLSYSNNILSIVRKAQEEGLANILRAVLSTKKKRQVAPKTDSQTMYNRVAAFLERQGSADVLGPFESFEARYLEDPRLKSVVGDINSVEKKIEQAMVPRDKLQSLIRSMFSGKEVLFKDNSIDVQINDRVSIGLSQLSSGEKQLLWIFVETLLAGDNSILIDEPEISMHVDWQKQLVAAMQKLSPSAQLILATHSPEIMADIPNDRIFPL